MGTCRRAIVGPGGPIAASNVIRDVEALGRGREKWSRRNIRDRRIEIKKRGRGATETGQMDGYLSFASLTLIAVKPKVRRALVLFVRSYIWQAN